jgi:hypothetical protein
VSAGHWSILSRHPPWQIAMVTVERQHGFLKAFRCLPSTFCNVSLVGLLLCDLQYRLCFSFGPDRPLISAVVLWMYDAFPTLISRVDHAKAECRSLWL